MQDLSLKKVMSWKLLLGCRRLIYSSLNHRLPWHELCRLDRTSGAGGGVAVFISNTIPFKVREDLISKSFECIWITIQATWLPREISRICISCVYLPPCETDVEGFYEYFYNCYDKLCMESPNSAFIVAGDFNPTNNAFQNRYLKSHCNFKQVVKKPTRGNNILDIIFTNIAGFYQVPCILAPLSTSDHCIVVWKPRDPRHSMKGKVLKVKHSDMRHANMNALDLLWRIMIGIKFCMGEILTRK